MSAPPVGHLPELVRSELERRLGSGLELPLLPEATAMVLAECQDERCDAARLARWITRDQALALHVLRIANSSVYAPREPIVSLQQAISRLGLGTLCEITLAVTLHARIFRAPGFEARLEELWRHSAVAGIFAKEIARAARRNVESAFLCGLLHDVGRPVVLQRALDVWDEGWGAAPAAHVLEAAMDAFHERVGALLAERWDMAPWLVESIRAHHDPARAGDHAEEAAIARLADLLSHRALAPTGPDGESLPDGDVLETLGLYDDDVERLEAQRKRILADARAFL